ncbi:hypothetical protein Sjap_008595 [Stephania japonica]|uniref:Uncharacterized protein n=1 Tax=Stephania japonica TaxID=461633 RepID=A0AAP0JQI4_9MAGN
MPNVGRNNSGGKGMSNRRRKRIEIPRAIAHENHVLMTKVLHRETKWIKLNRAIVIFSELTNRYTIFNEMGNN